MKMTINAKIARELTEKTIAANRALCMFKANEIACQIGEAIRNAAKDAETAIRWECNNYAIYAELENILVDNGFDVEILECIGGVTFFKIQW